MSIPRYVVSSFLTNDPLLVVHVGAHLGEEAESYRALGVKKTWWFEANPDLCDDLRKNVSPEDTVVCLAVSEVSSSENTFRVANKTGASSLHEFNEVLEVYPDIQEVKSIKVAVTSLDDYFQNSTLCPNYCVIDVQGGELSVLRGSRAVLTKVNLIEIEVNSRSLYHNAPFVKDLDAFLSKLEFRRVFTRWALRKGWGDALYAKSPKQATLWKARCSQFAIQVFDFLTLLFEKAKFEISKLLLRKK